MQLTYEQVLQISKGDPEIAAFIMNLLEQNARLEARVKELERQLGSKSNNSSKPPSSDGFRKPKSQRTAGEKIGGKLGHDGTTLRMVPNPDSIELHTAKICEHCHTLLDGEAVLWEDTRQVIDIPPITMQTVEHRVQHIRCPQCLHVSHGEFPSEVKAPVQYGDRLKALAVYLSVYQLLPVERIQQLIKDLTGHSPSEATILNCLDELNSAIEPLEKVIQEQLITSELIHTDETGARVAGQLHWLHSVSNENWTLYGVHEKRGNLAMDAMGVLPNYKGIVMHDCWVPYFNETYGFAHALCCAHLLRECQGVIDYDKQPWAQDMQTLLREAWHKEKQARLENQPLSPQDKQQIEQAYDMIIRQGELENPDSSNLTCQKKHGRKARPKPVNLLLRLAQFKQAVLRFLNNPCAPFDNNQAERDIRMMKVKQKVSGSFRTIQGAKIFARIRGFISTIRKQNYDVLQSLIKVLHNQFGFNF